MSSKKSWGVQVTVILTVMCVLVIAVILIRLSVRGIHYYEYGFLRTKSTGEVDTSRVYLSGLYPIGPNKDFITFQADAHFVHLDDLSCGTKSGNEIKMTVDIQYLLSKDELKHLYEEYNDDYDDIIEASAKEALKQTTVQFENLEFIRERDRIEMILYKAVKDRIHDRCCPVHCQSDKEADFCEDCIERPKCTTKDKGLYVHLYQLQLGEITIPGDLRERFLNALLLQAKTEQAALAKNATIIEQETQVLVSVIENEAVEIKANASAEADSIIGQAEAEARLVVEGARVESLHMVISTLNLTNSYDVNMYNYYTNINRMHNKDISLNFEYNIASP